MSIIKNKRNITILVLVEALLSIGVLSYIIFNKVNAISAIALIMITILIPLFVIFPYYSLLFLIMIRNITDIYAENAFIGVFNFSLNFSSILSILFISWSFFLILKEKINLRKIPLFWPWMLFLGLSFISFIYSVDLSESLKMIIRLISFYFLFVISYYFFHKYSNKVKYFVIALFASYIIPCIFGLVQIINNSGFVGPENMSRVNGTYVHPNAFAFNLLFLFIFGASIYTGIKNQTSKKSLFFYLVLISILIFFTLTRSVWIGYGLMILFLIFLYRRNKIINYVFIIFSIIFSFLILVNYTPLKYYNLDNIVFVKRMTSADMFLSSWDWRLKSWKEMTPYIYESPIYGHGINTYSFLKSKASRDYYESTRAHNDFFMILIELGFIGLLLYLNLIFNVLRKIYIKYKLSHDNKFLISFIGIFIIFAISAVDNTLSFTSLQWVLWVYIAYILS